MAEIMLGIEDIDLIHTEFEEIVKRFETEDFLTTFATLLEHTKRHFEYEENKMAERNFHGIGEHKEEHKKLLDEMHFFYERSKRNRAFGESYVKGYLKDKFANHIKTIDSQMAMFFKSL